MSGTSRVPHAFPRADVALPGQRPLMFDLGAHKGLDTGYYLDQGFKVIAVEAHPKIVAKLTVDNTFPMIADQLVVVSAAITPDGNSTPFYESSKGIDGETHSTFPHRVKGCESAPFEVAGTTLAQLFVTYGVPEYLKIDIEGADVIAIRQLHTFQTNTTKLFGAAKMPAYLSVELDWEHPEEALEIFSHLAYMGYERFAMVQQHWDVTVDYRKVKHSMCLADAVCDWTSRCGFVDTKDLWFDLHSKHKDAP